MENMERLRGAANDIATVIAAQNAARIDKALALHNMRALCLTLPHFAVLPFMQFM
jgi:hypothetical protein